MLGSFHPHQAKATLICSITIALKILLLTLALGNCSGDPPLGPDPAEEARLPEQLGIVQRGE
jgi:hypothetical protein